MLRRNVPGQSILEYTIIVSLLVIVVLALQPMFKRNIQGMVKVVADQIGNQEESDQRSLQNAASQGYIDSSYVVARSNFEKGRDEFLGNVAYTFDDAIRISSNTYQNLGFQPDP